MIDIHHHLLWDLDDGASSLETSLAMARVAAEDGITHVVCSPHANMHYAYDSDVVAAKIDELQRLLDKEQIVLKLGRGCDFHMSYENIQEAKADPTRPRGMTEILYELRLAGLTPILTHPERNPTLQADEARMLDWLRGGLLVQVTAGSVLGHMGKKAERMSHQLLANRWVHFLATDAHNTTSRPPRMHAAFDLVAQRYGSDYAHLLCVSNPLAVFMGNPMPPQMEPLNLYEEFKEKNWWQRLMSR